MKQPIIAMLLLLLTVVSCKKDDQNEETAFSGTITLNSPENGTVISGGSGFQIIATISGNKEMHGYVLTLYNNMDQSVIYTSNNLNHASSYSINETATHNLTVATPLRLVIEAEVDHDGETLKKEIIFSYQP